MIPCQLVPIYLSVGGYKGILNIENLGGTSLKKSPCTMQHNGTMAPWPPAIRGPHFWSVICAVSRRRRPAAARTGRPDHCTGRAVRGRRPLGRDRGNTIQHDTTALTLPIIQQPTPRSLHLSVTSQESLTCRVLADTDITAGSTDWAVGE